MFWLHYPLFKITPVFILGLIFGFYFPDYLLEVGGFSLALIILLGVSLCFKKLALLSEVLIYPTLLFLGVFCWNSHYPLNNSKHYSHFVPQNQPTFFVGEITERLKPNDYAERYIFKVHQVHQQSAKGLILISIPKQKTTQPLIGQSIAFVGTIKSIPKKTFEGAFDYAAYLKNQGVFHKIWIPLPQLFILKNQTSSVTLFLNQIRERIIQNLNLSGANSEHLSIFKALFLGQRQDINPEVNQDFIQAGVIHVLAISGLHIGIILWVFSLLLSPLEQIKNGKWIKVVLLILGLWFFAFITGLPASVVRATTMFTFITIALHLGRTTAIYNALLGSLLLILIFKPTYIFDVGFQLSYVAVFSIVWMQPLFKKWNPFQSKIIQYPYDLLTVSLSAQIGVLPLSFFYFHQFPALFLLCNLLVIPLVTLLLMLGVPLLFVLYFTPISSSIQVFYFLLDGLINVTHWLASFTKFIITDIPFTGLLLITAGLLIVTLVELLKQPTAKKSLLFLGTLVIFQLSILFEKNKSPNQAYIFNVFKKSLIVEHIHPKLFSYGSDDPNDTFQENLIKQYSTQHFIQSHQHQNLPNVLQIGGKKVFVVDYLGAYLKSKNYDILLLTQSPKINLERLLLTNHPKIVVADGSNYPSLVKQWKQTCTQKNIPFHATAEKGYYKIY